jgi:UDP-N-acetyl-D-mannosaminuronic acid dehydrogenase
MLSLLEECLSSEHEFKPQDYRIAVLGVAFIEDSDDPRNTPTKLFVEHLKDKGYNVVVHDHLVRQDEVDFQFSSNLDDVIKDSNALVIFTAHQIYKDLDLHHIKSIMAENPILIDGRTTFDPESVVQKGFNYRAVGRGQYRN